MNFDDIVRAIGSQKKLADAAGVKQQAVAHWQKNNRVPVRRAKAVLEICRRHDIEVNLLDLVGLADDD
jgi:DNA-binding transcriptional regulator YiaG